MASLEGSKTHDNLKAAFAGESQANRRYLYFAKEADVEGRPDIAGLFRDTAEGETGHAHGHLDFLEGGDLARPPGYFLCLSGSTKEKPKRPFTQRCPPVTLESLGEVTRTMVLSCTRSDNVQPTPQ